MTRSDHKKTILIVEDDHDIANILSRQLKILNFNSEIAINGHEAISKINLDNFDLILLDRMLPDILGIEICQYVRNHPLKLSTPIIFLTALGESNHIIEGLNAGADDYIAKPFDFKILEARINSLLRRISSVSSINNSIYKIGELELNTSSCKVSLNSADISFTLSEFKILKELLIHRGIVLKREKLVSAIAGEDIFVTPRTIDTHMTAIRKKIEPYHTYIETIRGIGYRLKD